MKDNFIPKNEKEFMQLQYEVKLFIAVFTLLENLTSLDFKLYILQLVLTFMIKGHGNLT